MLQTFAAQQWNGDFADRLKQHATTSLESGQIIYFPTLAFDLMESERQFLTPNHSDPQAKNISYGPDTKKLWGVQQLTDRQHLQLKQMLHRFYTSAHSLIQTLLPQYAKTLTTGRTSFRPIQIHKRKISKRKDDTLLHIDAFPSAPNQGKRILRVFCNINPHAESRIWRVGESFENIAQQFLSKIKKPLPGSAAILRFLKITKSYRSLYDHYMLSLHDTMKADRHFQKNSPRQEIQFPPGSAWIAHTDCIPHAAMSGQYLLEQTFYYPVSAMQDEALSPLRILEKLVNRPLL